MVRYSAFFTVFLLALAAQEKSAEKPTARAKARELLDKAVDAIAATQPEVQTAGLIHIAELYTEFDKKKALALFDQAFGAAAALPTTPVDKQAYMQSQVIALAAEMDVDKGIELLRMLPAPQSGRRDNRVRPIEAIVRRLIADKKLDPGIELVTTLGSDGEFAFRAASDLLRALPDNDPRRIQLFSAATTAYNVRPAGPLTEFVGRHWKEFPAQMAEAAVDAVLRPLLTAKPEQHYTQTMSSALGSVSFDSREDAELFNLIHVIQAVNPKRAAELLEKRLGLKEALVKFPQGKLSMGDDIRSNSSSGSARRPEETVMQRLESLSAAKAMEAADVSGKDVDRAVALAGEIPLPHMRAQVLAALAENLAEKDPSRCKALLTASLNVQRDVKEPERRIDNWVKIATAAWKAKDEERARFGIDKALDDAALVLKEDTHAERPNLALREYWPSTQFYRRAMYAATTFWGIDAENMLPRISDPEINQLITIEMARALLRKTSRANNMMSDRRSR